MVMLYRRLAKDILTERDAHSHRRFIDWFEMFNTQSSALGHTKQGETQITKPQVKKIVI